MTERQRLTAQEAAAIMNEQRDWIGWLLMERAEMLNLIEQYGTVELLQAAQLQLRRSHARLAILSHSPGALH